MRTRLIAIVASLAAVAATAVPAAAQTTTTPPDRTAGVVTSFSGGTLTITLDSGATLTGQVVPRTRIACRGRAAQAPATATPQTPATATPQAQRRGRRVRRVIRRVVRDVLRHQRRGARERRCAQNYLQPGTGVRHATLLAAPRDSTFTAVVLLRGATS